MYKDKSDTWLNVAESYKVVARVIRNKRKTMFGVVLHTPNAVNREQEFSYLLVYGSSCFYFNTMDEVKKECVKHDWTMFLQKVHDNKETD